MPCSRRVRDEQHTICTETYRDMSSFYKRFYNPLPADAVTIPASARDAFHLPPACHPIGGSGASPVRCPFCPSTATPRLELVNLSHFHIDTTHCVTIRPETHYFVVLARILLHVLWVEMLHPKDNLKHIIHHLRRIEMRTNQYWDKRLRPCKDSTTAF